MKKILGLGLVAAFSVAIMFTGCADNGAGSPEYRDRDVLGTVITPADFFTGANDGSLAKGAYAFVEDDDISGTIPDGYTVNLYGKFTINGGSGLEVGDTLNVTNGSTLIANTGAGKVLTVGKINGQTTAKGTVNVKAGGTLQDADTALANIKILTGTVTGGGGATASAIGAADFADGLANGTFGKANATTVTSGCTLHFDTGAVLDAKITGTDGAQLRSLAACTQPSLPGITSAATSGDLGALVVAEGNTVTFGGSWAPPAGTSLVVNGTIVAIAGTDSVDLTGMTTAASGSGSLTTTITTFSNVNWAKTGAIKNVTVGVTAFAADAEVTISSGNTLTVGTGTTFGNKGTVTDGVTTFAAVDGAATITATTSNAGVTIDGNVRLVSGGLTVTSTTAAQELKAKDTGDSLIVGKGVTLTVEGGVGGASNNGVAIATASLPIVVEDGGTLAVIGGAAGSSGSQAGAAAQVDKVTANAGAIITVTGGAPDATGGVGGAAAIGSTLKTDGKCISFNGTTTKPVSVTLATSAKATEVAGNASIFTSNTVTAVANVTEATPEAMIENVTFPAMTGTGATAVAAASDTTNYGSVILTAAQ